MTESMRIANDSSWDRRVDLISDLDIRLCILCACQTNGIDDIRNEPLHIEEDGLDHDVARIELAHIQSGIHESHELRSLLLNGMGVFRLDRGEVGVN